MKVSCLSAKLRSQRWGATKRCIRAILCAFVLAGCGAPAATSSSAPGASSAKNATSSTASSQKVVVHLLLGSPQLDMSYAPYLVAQTLGYFAAENLQVDIAPIAGSSDVVKQVAQGSAEFGHLTPEPVMIGHQPGQGIAVKFFYTMVQKLIYAIDVPETSSIQSFAELRGKRIGVTNLASGSVAVVRALAKEAGMDPDKDIHIVAVGAAAQAATAVQRGQVDALALWDTQYAILANLGLKLRTVPTPSVANFPSAGLIARDQLLESNPKLIEGFGRAVAKATVFVNSNPEAAVSAAWKARPELKPAGQDESKAMNDALGVIKSRLPNMALPDGAAGWGYSSPQQWAGYASFLLGAGVLSTKIDPTAVYTNDFVKQFNSFDQNKVKAEAAAYKP